MRANFDTKKSPLEKKIETASKILERTHPEQTADAMADYASALAALGNNKDMRVTYIIDGLKRLYVYPNRPEHNKLLVDLYDLKELLYETRINQNLEGKNKNPNLGEEAKPKNWPWLLISLIALFVLFKPS
jgi:hypothetical protein